VVNRPADGAPDLVQEGLPRAIGGVVHVVMGEKEGAARPCAHRLMRAIAPCGRVAGDRRTTTTATIGRDDAEQPDVAVRAGTEVVSLAS